MSTSFRELCRFAAVCILLLIGGNDAAAKGGKAHHGGACADPLVSSMIARVAIEGDPHGRAAAREVLCRLTASPFGRSLTAQWVANGSSITLRWARIPGSEIVTTTAGPRISGTTGLTDAKAARVTLNSLFLETRPIDLDAAVALSHELFGHLVAETAARAAGEDILLVYQGFSSDNETYANLVGWIVSLELGRRPDLHEARLFVSNRAQYYDALWKRNDWTAPLLTSDQMLRPAAEFNRRRLEARELFQRTHDPSLEPILAKLEKIARIFSDGENERDLNGRFASAARSSFILEQSRQVQELSSRFEILWRNQKD